MAEVWGVGKAHREAVAEECVESLGSGEGP